MAGAAGGRRFGGVGAAALLAGGGGGGGASASAYDGQSNFKTCEAQACVDVPARRGKEGSVDYQYWGRTLRSRRSSVLCTDAVRQILKRLIPCGGGCCGPGGPQDREERSVCQSHGTGTAPTNALGAEPVPPAAESSPAAAATGPAAVGAAAEPAPVVLRQVEPAAAAAGAPPAAGTVASPAAGLAAVLECVYAVGADLAALSLEDRALGLPLGEAIEVGRLCQPGFFERLVQDPRAVVFVEPVPTEMSFQELRTILSAFGPLRTVDQVDKRKASVQFAQVDHARAAVAGLRGSDKFPENVRIFLKDDEPAGGGGGLPGAGAADAGGGSLPQVGSDWATCISRRHCRLLLSMDNDGALSMSVENLSSKTPIFVCGQKLETKGSRSIPEGGLLGFAAALKETEAQYLKLVEFELRRPPSGVERGAVTSQPTPAAQ